MAFISCDPPFLQDFSIENFSPEFYPLDIAREGRKKEKLVKSKLLTSGYSMVPPGRFERPTPALGGGTVVGRLILALHGRGLLVGISARLFAL